MKNVFANNLFFVFFAELLNAEGVMGMIGNYDSAKKVGAKNWKRCNERSTFQ